MTKIDDGVADDTRQIAIRLPVMLLDRLQQHVARMRRDNPGVNVTRADAIRALLIGALDRAEERTSA